MNIRTDGKHLTADLTPYEVDLLASHAEAALYAKSTQPGSRERELAKMLRALRAGADLVSS